MKRFVFQLVILATLFVLILPVGGLAAATGPANPLSGPDGPQRIYLPLIVNNASLLMPIIPETTNTLPPETTQQLTSVSSDGVTYTFAKMTPALAAVAPGEIMVAAPSNAAPDGFLRRVTAVNTTGGQVVVQTQAATLEDAIQQGEVYVNQRLSPTNAQAVEIAPGITLMPSSVVSPDASFYVKMEDVVVYDDDGNLSTKDDQVVANGSIEFAPTVDFRLLIRDWEIEELYFAANAQETAELEFETKLQKSLIEKEFLLSDPIQLAQIVAMVGPVPVVLIPVLTFQVGIDGSVHVGVVTRVEQVLTATAGARYAGGAWGPVSELSNQFTFTPPTLHAGLDFKGYANARLQLLLYGVAGPYASVGPYLKLEADTSKTPWWELYGGLEVPVGVRVDLLGYKKVADYQVLAIGTKQLIAQATTPPLAYPWMYVQGSAVAAPNCGVVFFTGQVQYRNGVATERCMCLPGLLWSTLSSSSPVVGALEMAIGPSHPVDVMDCKGVFEIYVVACPRTYQVPGLSWIPAVLHPCRSLTSSRPRSPIGARIGQWTNIHLQEYDSDRAQDSA